MALAFTSMPTILPRASSGEQRKEARQVGQPFDVGEVAHVPLQDGHEVRVEPGPPPRLGRPTHDFRIAASPTLATTTWT